MTNDERKKIDNCINCGIPVIFCVGDPKQCKKKYERYMAMKAKQQARAAARAEQQEKIKQCITR